MGVQLVESDFKGPLPPNTVGLLPGHSSVTLQGLVVHPGVIDSVYTGQVKIMVSSPRGIVAISPGVHIAQLLLLPSCHSKFPANDKERGNRGFGSMGATSIYYSMELDERPLFYIAGRGKSYFRIA
jgi:dUTPase